VFGVIASVLLSIVYAFVGTVDLTVFPA